MVSAMAVQEDTQQRWRQRPWRLESEHNSMAYTPVPDVLRLTSWGDDEVVYRPPRIMREIVS
jgi:hypothetical protein